MYKSTLFVAALSCVTLLGPAANAENRVDWPVFMAQQDPVWKRLPSDWGESPFLGNGTMGTMVYQNGPENPRQLRIDVHHAGVTDQRGGSAMFGTARLPIGYFVVETVGEMQRCDLRLDLWNAELRGSVTTSAGTFELRAIVPAEEMLIAVEVIPDAGERELSIRFEPQPAVSPRATSMGVPDNYALNPNPEVIRRDEIQVCRQPLLAGGEHATAWRIVQDPIKDSSPGQQVGAVKKTLLASVDHSFPQTTAADSAVARVRKASARSYGGLLVDHRQWWHDFYPTSFVSFSDDFWQSFYWIQMYKLGAATRADGYLIDNHGPWLQPTRWPYATWNLNVQLTYWPLNASGHLREALSLPRHLIKHREQLRENVQPAAFRDDSYAIGRGATEKLIAPLPRVAKNGREIGNLPWALHNVWLQYRHTMDDRLLRQTLFPLLRGSINYYLHLLEESDQGRLHLPVSISPEYGSAPDCNYDLSLLRWGCETLLQINERLDLDDPLADRWREVLDKLTDFPGDDDRGFHIGRGVPYEKSHRHYSHLLMIYPLYLVNIDQPGGREQIEKCIANWHSRPKALRGYSMTGSSSMYAAIGDGDRALEKLNELRSFLLPNTMYREGGPVIETPLSGAQSIHDLLVQSWGGVIRVFPAAPSSWSDIAVEDLRTEGAYELSAVREGGITQWVRLKSLAGEPMQVLPGIEAPVIVTSNQAELKPTSEGRYLIDLPAGEEVLFRRPDFTGETIIGSVHEIKSPPFGLLDL